MPSNQLSLSIALALFVTGLGLISTGTHREVDGLWVGGLALLAAGGLIGPTLRFTAEDEEDGS